MERLSFNAFSSTFIVDSDYVFVKEIGQGAYSCVIAAKHRKSGQDCAIKKITNIDTKGSLMRRCLKEISLLHHFHGHKNITSLYDMDIVFKPNGGSDEVYVYEELMGANLLAIIRSGQPLSDAHLQSLLYQTLCGLKYIHSANVLHKDLKPRNLLVNDDCELKICGFGSAIGYSVDSGAVNASAISFASDYVPATSLRYRAPEIILSFPTLTTAIDVWSVGCIFAELLGGSPIFKGKDFVDHLSQILHCLGTPSDETLGRVGSPRAQDYVRGLPIKPTIPFSTLYPHANPLAIDLLSQLLVFDPEKRISCEQALSHPYFAEWHDPADEPVCDVPCDFGFEDEESVEGMKKLIVEKVDNFRSFVRSRERGAEQTLRKDSLSIPTRDDDDIISPAVTEHAPADRATSRPSQGPTENALSMGPVLDNLSEELAGTHLASKA